MGSQKHAGSNSEAVPGLSKSTEQSWGQKRFERTREDRGRQEEGPGVRCVGRRGEQAQ